MIQFDKVFSVVTIMFLSATMLGQNGLKVGSIAPNFVFEKMVNYPLKSVTLKKDLQDKLVILDYWTKSCYPCILDFYRLDSIQRQFDNISIDINAKTDNFKKMREALAEYGLDLSIQKREKEVYVVKNSNP